jgi:hypothetical protein
MQAVDKDLRLVDRAEKNLRLERYKRMCLIPAKPLSSRPEEESF